MGAAAAVLLKGSAPRTAPLHLTGAKSFMGHAEPAAGIVGVVQLSLALGRQLADPILHLAAVNPYVASAGGLRMACRRFADAGCARQWLMCVQLYR